MSGSHTQIHDVVRVEVERDHHERSDDCHEYFIIDITAHTANGTSHRFQLFLDERLSIHGEI